MFHKHLVPFQIVIKPLPDDKILDWFKSKQTADDNFKFDENSRKFCKQVENSVGKGEIACYEQFLHFRQCFHKACFLEASNGVIVWEWVNSSLHNTIFSTTLGQSAMENIVGKRENAGDFILLRPCFLHFSPSFEPYFICYLKLLWC